jgi:UPF0755 protein
VSDVFLGSHQPGADQYQFSDEVPRSRRRAERRAERRRRRRRGTIAMIVAFLLVASAGYFLMKTVWPGLTGGASSANVHDYPGPGHGSVQVVVKTGDTGADIGSTLLAQGVVATKSAYTDASKANPKSGSIQPGTYTMLLEMKATDAVTRLLDPNSRVAYKVTIPEGLRATQIYDRISSVTTISVADITAAAANPAAIGLPAQAGGNVEGWLFPATYNFEPSSTATDILKQMVAKTVATLDADAVPPEQRETVLIVASIAGNEVTFPEEYAKVARVIDNRLARQIPLGMDTINAYGLNKKALDLTADDLKADNPYNSRLHLGLPPTPISNPGDATIKAALSPAPGDWTYFVTVNLDTGETVFTSDYNEFLAGKAKFEQWLKAKG